MKNQRKFVVIDAENNIAWDAKKECGKTFQTYGAARKEAVELAESNPGGQVLICKAHAVVCADVGPVLIRNA